ncbi:ceramidase domain-containing protein [Aurantivibrio infirmus]
MKQPIESRVIVGLIALVVAFIVVVGVFVPTVPQDPNYHLFIDRETILNVSNFWNVVSNSLFLLVGIVGLIQLYVLNNLKILPEIKSAYGIFFLGVTLVAFGSGYYHLLPNNQTLVWDRLPMTIAFMSLFSVVVGETVSIRLARFSLLPLIVSGGLSVLYWHFTELQGRGDLRFYALVQFLPLLLIPIMLVFLPSKFSHKSGYWYLFAFYIIAKLLEQFDSEVDAFLGFISGHSLKHIAAAFGVLILLYTFRRRGIIS